jgi:hypothetical protein
LLKLIQICGQFKLKLIDWKEERRILNEGKGGNAWGENQSLATNIIAYGAFVLLPETLLPSNPASHSILPFSNPYPMPRPSFHHLAVAGILQKQLWKKQKH